MNRRAILVLCLFAQALSIIAAEEPVRQLRQAVEEGDIPAARALIRQVEDPDVSDSGLGEPLLLTATRNDNPEMVTLLIGNGAKVRAADDEGTTALHRARSKVIAQMLLTAGADIEARDASRGMTPLLAALENGQLEVAALLVESGADVNRGDRDDRTPLMAAARANNAAVVSQLIAKGADVKRTNAHGETALHVAASFAALEAAHALIDGGAATSVQTLFLDTPLHAAASAGHGGLVKLLLSNGANPWLRDSLGWTPLACAEHAYAKLGRVVQPDDKERASEVLRSAMAQRPESSFDGPSRHRTDSAMGFSLAIPEGCLRVTVTPSEAVRQRLAELARSIGKSTEEVSGPLFGELREGRNEVFFLPGGGARHINIVTIIKAPGTPPFTPAAIEKACEALPRQLLETDGKAVVVNACQSGSFALGRALISEWQAEGDDLTVINYQIRNSDTDQYIFTGVFHEQGLAEARRGLRELANSMMAIGGV